MSKTYYESKGKDAIMAEPQKYAWNCVLCFLQFTQDELLAMREWIELRPMIQNQRSVTRDFLRAHFAQDIDDSLEVDWSDVEKHVPLQMAAVAGTDALPFLFMGCWNLPGAGRDRVTKAICEESIQHLVLGGDNVYPKKTEGANGKKSKVYHRDLLEEGLTALGCKTILGSALGNHNVADPAIAKRQIGALTPAGRTYFTQDYSDVSLLFLDTNVVGEAADEMFAWLSGELARLRTAKQTYYLIQHEPVLGFKKDKIHAYVLVRRLLESLIVYPPVAILCADTHHYQSGVLTYKDVPINQYIVGTGGAAPDTMTWETNTILFEDDIHYERHEFISGYGYARITDTGVKFIKVAEWGSSGGAGHKTRRAKRRARKSRRKLRR